MVRRTFLSNLFSVQSDCPAREKFGYGGDIVATSESMIFNFDMAAFYLKAIRDFGDAAGKTGVLTETAPFVGIADGGFGERSAPPGWAVAHPLLQDQLFRYYGACRTMEEQYGIGCRWLGLLESRAKDHIIDRGISDHESLAPRPVPVTGTSFYYENARLMERLARRIGREEDAIRFSRTADEIKTAFIKTFFDPKTGRVHTGTQACQAAALFFDLLPPRGREAALDVLLETIKNQDRDHLSTGIFGTRYLLNVLTDTGHADAAYTVVNQKTFPGWGHMLKLGATTLWEHWDYSDNTYSHNHPMFGMVSEWFFKALGGINAAPEGEGFSRILIQPNPVGDLTWARTRYESMRGIVSTYWRLEGGRFLLEVRIRFLLEVRIPPNTCARVRLPAKGAGGVLEGGKPALQAEWVRLIREEKDAVMFEVASGEYHFSAPFPNRRAMPSKNLDP
jgi:alpha-L-rhamnosidase